MQLNVIKKYIEILQLNVIKKYTDFVVKKYTDFVNFILLIF